jgi:hypothetical protein
METSSNIPDGLKIPEEFPKIVKDFITDISNTFPEYNPLIQKWWKDKTFFTYIDNEEERETAFKNAQEKSIIFLFNFCIRKFPSRFFDILYQNESIFDETSELDTEFLPHLHFKNLWQFDISSQTKETIWKYLQLILFSITGSVENKEAFGDSAKIFENINEEEFKNKLEETLNKMHGLFDNLDNKGEDGCNDTDNEEPKINMNNLPNADRIHEHITGMLDGKLGQLAKEIAEETAQELDMDMDNVSDMKDVFSKLLKNPTKLMGLVKNVGSKLDDKIKSGDIKESELISEASDILNKMKNMPGMDNLQEMLGKMGLGGKGAKVDMNAMEAQLNRNMKKAEMKERIKKKSEMRKNENLNNNLPVQPNPNALSEEQLISIFSSGEKVEKSLRGDKPPDKKKVQKGKGKK